MYLAQNRELLERCLNIIGVGTLRVYDDMVNSLKGRSERSLGSSVSTKRRTLVALLSWIVMTGTTLCTLVVCATYP